MQLNLLRRRDRLVLGILLLLLPALAAPAEAQFNCITNNGTIFIIKYTGSSGALTIPGTINGLPVAGISDFAFSGNTNITSVTIPDGLSSIANYAFGYCVNLTNVVLSDSVTTLGSGVFDYCYSLTSITIPKNVTSIGIALVNGSYGVTAISVDTLNPNYRSEGGVLFNKSQTTLIEYPGALTGAYTIPNTVTNIEDYAFAYCVNLTHVTVPNGVTHIGTAAFFNSGITYIIVPRTLATIGSYAFYSCANLGAVYFEGNVPAYGDGAFDLDPKATVYYLPDTTGWGPTFAGCPTAFWRPQMQTDDADFGIKTNQFGFTINWAADEAIVVEACTNLANAVWSPILTSTLTSNSFYFSDPQWKNYPARFYRLRAP